jgi:hypothetical protein
VNRTIFWLALPLRYIMGAMMWLMCAAVGEPVVIDWNKLATRSFDEAVKV